MKVTLSWQIAGSSSRYRYWVRLDEDGRFFYYSTPHNQGPPPQDSGGYYNLDALRRLQGDDKNLIDLVALEPPDERYVYLAVVDGVTILATFNKREAQEFSGPVGTGKVLAKVVNLPGARKAALAKLDLLDRLVLGL